MSHRVEVLYLTELLQDALEYTEARVQATRAVLKEPRLGEELRDQLAGYLDGLPPETVVSYERNVLTNARLEDAGIEVIRVPGGELAGCRGGPRAICCPLAREPASMPDENARAA